MTTDIETPDWETLLAEGLQCLGCGAELQITDRDHSGFVPKSALLKQLVADSDQLLCQRCFRLRHYNEIQPVELTNDDFMALLHGIADKNALIVYVMDVFDVTGSQIAGLQRFVGQHNPILVVANKVDLLPKSLNKTRLKHWLSRTLKEQGIQAADVFLTSAQHPNNLDDLLATIDHLRAGRDAYIVGVTNVGKSTLINQILKSRAGVADAITTSRYPGTTLDTIEIPLDDGSHLIDTPGIIKDSQMAHYLSADTLKYALPQHEIKQRVYQLNAEQTLFVGGLTRCDFVAGERQGIVAYFDNNLTVHRTKLAGADDFYSRHAGDLLAPTATTPLVRHQFRVTEPSDIVVAGLGWFMIPTASEVAVWAPENVAVLIRKAMI